MDVVTGVCEAVGVGAWLPGWAKDSEPNCAKPPFWFCSGGKVGWEGESWCWAWPGKFAKEDTGGGCWGGGGGGWPGG